MKRTAPLLLVLVTLPLVAALAWMVVANTGDSGSRQGVQPSTDEHDPAGAVTAAAGTEPAAADLARTQISGGPAAAEPSAVRISGRVVDAHGEPLARAQVGDTATDRPAITDADGQFDVLVVGVERSITLLALAAEHAPSATTLPLADGVATHDAGDIQLLRGGRVRGRVTVGADQGLDGATVTLRLSLGAGTWPANVDLGRLLPPATTNAGGTYSFTHLAPGTYRVEATSPGMQPGQVSRLTVRDGVETVADAIALAAGHVLSGVVLAPGDAPVAGAVVRVRRGANQTRSESQAETSADGRFRHDALPPGPLQVEVTKTGFLSYSRTDVDASSGAELVVRLEAGLRITGTVVDRRSGQPVERFAAVLRRSGADGRPPAPIDQQLQSQIQTLRTAAATATDPQRSAHELQLATEFEARLEGVKQRSQSRLVAVPADVGQVTARPGGRFVFDGLEEGLYTVGIASPNHQYAQVEGVDVRRASVVPELRFELSAGSTLAGIVITRHDRVAVAGATVELVRVAEAPAASVLPSATQPQRPRSLYPWVFARSGARGVTVMTTLTARDGSFEFRQAAPGRYSLSLRHDRIAEHDTDVFDLLGDQRNMRVEVGALATLTGRVGNVPLSQQGNVAVFVLGGHGAMRTVKAAADGSYRCDALQPGSYLVRAFPADASQYLNRLFGSMFPLHAGAVDPEKAPQPDVTLAEGEARTLDLRLDLPAAGVVQGTVAINARPGKGGTATLRPLPGEAPGAGGLSLRGNCDDLGRFTIPDVPAGNYTLVVRGPTRQDLHSEPLTVAPGATSVVQVDVRAGGVRGRISTPDAATPGALRGAVWVLPGAKEAPADFHAYQRTERTHRIAIRDGMFEDAGLTPGPAMVAVDVRGRNLAWSRVVVPAGDTVALDLTAGTRQQ